MFALKDAIPVKESVKAEEVGATAIPTYVRVSLREDMGLGAQVLANFSPRQILVDTIKNKEWFKGLVLSAAFFEHFGFHALRTLYEDEISEGNLKHLDLAHIIVLLFGSKLIDQPTYSKMTEVRKKRNDLVHKPFVVIPPKEAEKLIQKAIECLEYLDVAD